MNGMENHKARRLSDAALGADPSRLHGHQRTTAMHSGPRDELLGVRPRAVRVGGTLGAAAKTGLRVPRLLVHRCKVRDVGRCLRFSVRGLVRSSEPG